MPDLVPQQPPPPDYYAANLRTILHHVQDHYLDLLDARESDYIETLLGTSTAAQRLFARLLSRKGPWIRIDKLDYAEIEDVDTALAELSEAGLVALNGPAPADALLGLLTTDERTRLVPGIQAKNKTRWIESCVTRHSDERVRDLVAQSYPWVSLVRYGAIRLCQLLFFGDERQDTSTFVLRDLGLFRFESYSLDRSNRLFRDRAALARYLRLARLNQLTHRLEEHPQLAESLSSALWLPVHNRIEQRRRDRTLNRLGRWFERSGDFNAALECFARSRTHPGRERRTRMLTKLGDDRGAKELLAKMRSTPRAAEEEDFATRFGQRTRRQVIETTNLPIDHTPDSIERYAAQLLGSNGARVFHLENQLPLGITALAYWRVVFAEVPGAFVNRFQSAPLDMFWPDFAGSRRALIDAERQRLKNPACLRWLFEDTFRSKAGVANRMLSWRHFTEEVLDAVLLGIPHQRLIQLADHVIEQPYRTRTGFPDLFVVYGPGNYEFVEVKGPNDQLQPAQRVWFKALERMGQPARVLKFKSC